MRTKKVISTLSVSLTLILLTSCSNNSSEKKNTDNSSSVNSNKFEIIAQKKFRITDLYFCLVPDDNVDEMRNIAGSLMTNSKVAFVYFYTDKNGIKDISNSTDLLSALPEEGFIAKFDKSPGFGIQYEKPSPPTTKFVNKASGSIKINQLEKKVRKEKYIWYTFYVENYIATKETENKMIEVAKKLPYVPNGFTEVFFFNDKINAPKLASDGGWNADESQNSWNKKYGQYCVGYYSVGAGDNGTFSKGWN